LSGFPFSRMLSVIVSNSSHNPGASSLNLFDIGIEERFAPLEAYVLLYSLSLESRSTSLEYIDFRSFKQLLNDDIDIISLSVKVMASSDAWFLHIISFHEGMGIFMSLWLKLIFRSSSTKSVDMSLFNLYQNSFRSSMFLSFSREINVRVEFIFLLLDRLSLRKLLISLDANPITTPKMVEIIGIYPVMLKIKISSINNFFYKKILKKVNLKLIHNKISISYYLYSDPF